MPLRVKALPPVIFLLLVALAGCTGQADPQIPAPAQVVAPNAGATTNSTARTMAVQATYEDYPTSASADCASPPKCAIDLPFAVNFTGSIRGQAVGVARSGIADWTTPNRIAFEKNPFTFTGTIEGCGSGTASFIVHGFFETDSEGLRANETIQYIDGSATTGLANLIDAVVYVDTHDYPGVVPATGTVWCR